MRKKVHQKRLHQLYILNVFFNYAIRTYDILYLSLNMPIYRCDRCTNNGMQQYRVGGGVILHVLHPIIEFDGHSSYQVLVHDIDHVSYFQDESGRSKKR